MAIRFRHDAAGIGGNGAGGDSSGSSGSGSSETSSGLASSHESTDLGIPCYTTCQWTWNGNFGDPYDPALWIYSGNPSDPNTCPLPPGVLNQPPPKPDLCYCRDSTKPDYPGLFPLQTVIVDCVK